MKGINPNSSNAIAFSELKIKETIYRINCALERTLPYCFDSDIKVVFASQSFKNKIIEFGKVLPLDSIYGTFAHNIAINKKYERILFISKDDFPYHLANFWNCIVDFIACSLSFSSLNFLNIVSGYCSRGTDVIEISFHLLNDHVPIVHKFPNCHLCASQFLLENTFAKRLIDNEQYFLTTNSKSFKHFNSGSKVYPEIEVGALYSCCSCGQKFINETRFPVVRLGELYEKHVENIFCWKRG